MILEGNTKSVDSISNILEILRVAPLSMNVWRQCNIKSKVYFS